MNPTENRHLIESAAALRDALERLNALGGSAPLTLLATGNDGRLEGTLTDGDIRRALLRGVSLDSPVRDVMNTGFKRLCNGSEDVGQIRLFRLSGIELVPVVDSDGRPVRLIDTRHTTTVLPLSALLMAGGRGERLRPLTLDTPKPLLKVGDRPIIDHNIAMLASAGITDITVSVNYLAEQIEAHFAKPVAGVKVKTVREPMFLGTIGSAALVSRENADGDTLVMNSDLLTTVNLEEMWMRHKTEKADITIAAVPYNVSVPYAILTTDGTRVSALREKPSMSYWANAGIYMIANRLLDTLTSDRRTDATDLIDRAIADGMCVTYYPLRGTWIDIGSPADYRHACDIMTPGFNSKH